MTHTTTTPPARDPAMELRYRRRKLALLGVVAVMGLMYWLGKPPESTTTTDTVLPTKDAQEPQPVEEWYATGRIAANGVVLENAEPIFGTIRPQPAALLADPLPVEVQLSDGEWVALSSITQESLKTAGFRYTAASRGPEHVWAKEYSFGTGGYGELNFGFSNEGLQTASVSAGVYPAGTIVEPAPKIRIDGHEIPLPITKADLVTLLGESGPPPDQPRRGRPPAAPSEPAATDSAPATPSQPETPQ